MKKWCVLARQPAGENSWLMDVLSETDGLIKVRSGKYTEVPDLLAVWRGDWKTSTEWPTLKAVEKISQYNLQDTALLCGLYVTELLHKLLTYGEPAPRLFQLYLETLNAIRDHQHYEVWLRFFEYRLLNELGFGFDWHTADSQPIIASGNYQWSTQQGLVHAEQGWSGSVLLAIGRNDFIYPGALSVARQVLRDALSEHLTKPLVSRELLMTRATSIR
ncbi:MAG: DNA repair protein RecO [Oleibacter sp.]|nr:DNA repair protein RecO [Thalassolituus sp.]